MRMMMMILLLLLLVFVTTTINGFVIINSSNNKNNNKPLPQQKKVAMMMMKKSPTNTKTATTTTLFDSGTPTATEEATAAATTTLQKEDPSFTSPATGQQQQQQQIEVKSSSSSSTSTSSTSKSSNSKEHAVVEMIPPNGSFRQTISGGQELSIVSYNMLAPYYASLAYLSQGYKAREMFLYNDRKERIPKAIHVALSTNADILCLQEVEGRTNEIESNLRQYLSESNNNYDMIWEPLLPHRTDDVVGLVVAWKSSKFNLFKSYGYKRGMIVQLQCIGTNALINIANVHLPARPSNILGRLHTISRTITKLDNMSCDSSADSSTSTSPLNGLMIVTGDFNGDNKSIAAHLLQNGSINYGTIRDRNYKSKLTKSAASHMRHYLNFQDVYGSPFDSNKDLRQVCASLTVSLKGREPGCMDQLFYCLPPTLKEKRKRQQQQQRIVSSSPPPSTMMMSSTTTNPNQMQAKNRQHQHMSKRTARRIKASQRMSRRRRSSIIGNHCADAESSIKIESVLATVFDDDIDRLNIIHDGLPNVNKGFPSDHIPIGALFTSTTKSTSSSSSNDDGRVVEVQKKGSSRVGEEEEETEVSTEPLSPQQFPPKIINGSSNISTTTTAAVGNSFQLRQEEHPQDEAKEGKVVDDGNYSDQPPRLQQQQRHRHNRQQRQHNIGGISSTVRRRRQTTIQSVGYRRRHNSVLGYIHSWLKNFCGADMIVRDQPLYKNPITKNLPKLKKKSRAPDLMCILHNTLVVIEIAVTESSNPLKIRNQKISKYTDLIDVLKQQLLVVVEDDDGDKIEKKDVAEELPSGNNSDDDKDMKIPDIHNIKLLTIVVHVVNNNTDETDEDAATAATADGCTERQKQQQIVIPEETINDIACLVEISLGLDAKEDESIIQGETQRFCEQVKTAISGQQLQM